MKQVSLYQLPNQLENYVCLLYVFVIISSIFLPFRYSAFAKPFVFSYLNHTTLRDQNGHIPN